MLAQQKRNVLLMVSGSLLLLIALIACTPEQVEVVVTEVVQVEMEVTRIVEGTPVVETIIEEVEVTRIVTEEVMAEPEEAGPTIITIGALSDNFNQEVDRSRFPNYDTHTGACEPLLRLGANYEIIPWLAESFEFVGDNTYRFYLREGVTFQDGSPLTAADVKWTFERNVRGGNTGSTRIGENSVTIVDDMTVDVTPNDPNLRLPEQIVHPTWAILKDGSEPIEEVICTGPWQVTDYTYREEINLVRYDGYWGNMPEIDGLTFRFYPDDSTRLLALAAGDIDFMFNLPPEEVGSVSAIDGIDVVTAPVGRNMLMYLNKLGEAPYDLLADINLRRAIGLAIDRDTLVNVILEGNATTDQSLAPLSILGDYANLVEGFDYDPDGAIALLEESGWVDSDGDGIREKDGRRLTLTMIGLPALPIINYEFIQAALADIGMEVTIVTSPDRPSFSAIRNAGEFDINLEGPNQNDGNPMFLPALRFYSKGPASSVIFFSPEGPEFDALVEEAAASSDIDEVRRLTAESMRILIDEQAIVIPVAGLFRIYAINSDIQGFDAHPSWANQWYDTLFINEQ